MKHQHTSSIATDPEFDGSKKRKDGKTQRNLCQQFAHLQKTVNNNKSSISCWEYNNMIE